MGGATSPLGWYVEDGDEVTYSDEVILLNGDLIINNGGVLIFENTELYSNARGDKNATLRIVVEEGGSFFVSDSLISSRYEVDQYKGNQFWRYKFEVYGRLNMTNTIVEYMWGNLEGVWLEDPDVGTLHQTNTGGIEIYSSDVFIQGCTITRGQSCGMNIREGSPIILDTEFIANDQIGMSILDSDIAAIIKGCTFSDNELRGITIHSDNLEFSDSVIQNNGGSGFFIINSVNVSFEGLEVTGNGRGLHVVLCDATFYNCTIVDNGVTMAVTNDGSVTLVNSVCDITGNDMDLHENCWAATTIPLEIVVEDSGNGVKNAKITTTGSDGNFTWSHTTITDSKGEGQALAGIQIRLYEYWYNITEFLIEVTSTVGSDSRSLNVSVPMSVNFELGDGSGGNDPNDGSDQDDGDGNDGDDDNDLWGIRNILEGDADESNVLIPVFIVIIVLGVILMVTMRRRNQGVGEGEDDHDVDAEWEYED